MRKQVLLIALLLAGLLNAGLVYSLENNVSLEKEVDLTNTIKRPTKSLLQAPDIRAYQDEDCVRITFNGIYEESVTITITGDSGEILHSETLTVNSSMEWAVLIDMEEAYLLEISTNNWYFYGEL